MTSFREFRDEHRDDDGLVLDTLPVAARSFQGDRAGFFTRLIAAVIDVVIVGGIIAGVWIAVWLFLLVFNPLVDYGMPRAGYFALGGYFLMFCYWAWFWSTSGRSIGQHLMGVRVVGRDGQRPGWKVASARSLFCVAFQVGILWIIVSRRNRSIQDLVLRTSVIHDWSGDFTSGDYSRAARVEAGKAEGEKSPRAEGASGWVS